MLVMNKMLPLSLSFQIANAVNEGQLVPEDIIFGLLSKRLEEGYYRGETGFILDGIPRTHIQAVSGKHLYHFKFSLLIINSIFPFLMV